MTRTLPRRSAFVYGTERLEFDIPPRQWAEAGSSIGGTAVAASGVPASYTVRTDRRIPLPLRYGETEQWKVDQLLAWGFTGSLLTWYPDTEVDTGLEVYLDSPAPGQDWAPEIDGTYPRVRTLQLMLRLAVAQPVPYLSPMAVLDYVPGMEFTSFARASAALYYDRMGMVRSAAAHTPRAGHFPVPGSRPHLLMERGASNILPYSQSLEDWDTAGVAPPTVTDGMVLAGVLELAEIRTTEEDGGYVTNNFTPDGAAAGPFSVFVRWHPEGPASDYTRIAIQDLDDADEYRLHARLTWDSNRRPVVVCSLEGGMTGSAGTYLGFERLGQTGIYRLMFGAAELVADHEHQLVVDPNPFGEDCAIFIGGAQVEYIFDTGLADTGSTYPTSYIVTPSTAPVARVSDMGHIALPVDTQLETMTALVVLRRPWYADLADLGLALGGSRCLWAMRENGVDPPEWNMHVYHYTPAAMRGLDTFNETGGADINLDDPGHTPEFGMGGWEFGGISNSWQIEVGAGQQRAYRANGSGSNGSFARHTSDLVLPVGHAQQVTANVERAGVDGSGNSNFGLWLNNNGGIALGTTDGIFLNFMRIDSSTVRPRISVFINGALQLDEQIGADFTWLTNAVPPLENKEVRIVYEHPTLTLYVDDVERGESTLPVDMSQNGFRFGFYSEEFGSKGWRVRDLLVETLQPAALNGTDDRKITTYFQDIVEQDFPDGQRLQLVAQLVRPTVRPELALDVGSGFGNTLEEDPYADWPSPPVVAIGTRVTLDNVQADAAIERLLIVRGEYTRAEMLQLAQQR